MKKTVSIIIPARNEQDTIGPVLDALADAIQGLPAYEFETIVVVDHIEDGTVAVARGKGAAIMVNDMRRGKGSALYYGFEHSRGDYIIILDSDGSHDPRIMGSFLAELDKGNGMVIGSRVLGGSDDHNVVRLFANALFSVTVSVLFGYTLMDTLNGYKAFVRGVVDKSKTKARGFDIEIELVAKALERNYRIVEVSAHEYRRAGGVMKSHAVRDGFVIMRSCLFHGLKFRWKRLIGAFSRRRECGK